MQISKTEPFEDLIKKWMEQDIQATTIHAHLVEQHGFTGSYNSVQRAVEKLKGHVHKLTVPLHFQPGQAARLNMAAG